MSYQKDPVDKFVEGLFVAGASAAWAVTAAVGSLAIRLLRKPPEKRLKEMNRSSGWGDSGQVTQCPSCQNVNSADMPLCGMCGARLE